MISSIKLYCVGWFFLVVLIVVYSIFVMCFSGWEISFSLLWYGKKHTRVKLISTDGDRDGGKEKIKA